MPLLQNFRWSSEKSMNYDFEGYKMTSLSLIFSNKIYGFVLWCYSLGYARSKWNKSTSSFSVGDLKARRKFEASGQVRKRKRQDLKSEGLDAISQQIRNWVTLSHEPCSVVYIDSTSGNEDAVEIHNTGLFVLYPWEWLPARWPPLLPHILWDRTRVRFSVSFNSSSAKVCEYSYNFLYWTLHSNKTVHV